MSDESSSQDKSGLSTLLVGGASEIEAIRNPKLYIRSLYRFVLLGPGLLMAGVLLCCAALFFAYQLWPDFAYGSGLLLLAAGYVLWRCLALAYRLQGSHNPMGYRLSPKQVPELEKRLKKIQSELKSAKIRRIVLTDDFSLSVSSYRRFLPFGGPGYSLNIGLRPLFYLSPPRMLALVAHELAHLRTREQPQMAAIYRSRQVWQHLANRLSIARRNKQSLGGRLFAYFVHWYVPRLKSKTEVITRREHFVADELAAKICTPTHLVGALIENELCASYFEQHFWPRYWQQAAAQKTPALLPLAWLQAHHFAPPSVVQREVLMAQIQLEPVNIKAIPPALKERCTALRASFSAPEPSLHNSTALLGDSLTQAIAFFDKAWWQTNQAPWQQAHVLRQQDLQRLQHLQARDVNQLNLDELKEYARLQSQLGTPADALALYQRVAQQASHDPDALLALATLWADRRDMQAHEPLRRLQNYHPQHMLRACHLALGLLGQVELSKDTIRKRNAWYTKLDEAKALEERYRHEIEQTRPWAAAKAHGLSIRQWQDFELSLKTLPAVRKAWLLRHSSQVLPQRVHYLLVVQTDLADTDTNVALLAAQRQHIQLPDQMSLTSFDWLLANEQERLGAAHYERPSPKPLAESHSNAKKKPKAPHPKNGKKKT
jgi:hypothetical protein